MPLSLIEISLNRQSLMGRNRSPYLQFTGRFSSPYSSQLDLFIVHLFIDRLHYLETLLR